MTWNRIKRELNQRNRSITAVYFFSFSLFFSYIFFSLLVSLWRDKISTHSYIWWASINRKLTTRKKSSWSLCVDVFVWDVISSSFVVLFSAPHNLIFEFESHKNNLRVGEGYTHIMDILLLQKSKYFGIQLTMN